MHARSKPVFLPGFDAGSVPADEGRADNRLPAAFGKALGASGPKQHLDALRLPHSRPGKKQTGDTGHGRKGGPATAKTEIPRSGHR